MIGYGGGRATAVVVDAARAVPGARRASSGSGPGRRASYAEALRARGQLEPMDDPIPMGLPPGGAAFVRGNPEMLGLFGAALPDVRDDLDAAVDPPHLHRVRGVRARGRGAGPPGHASQTFVVNQTMPPPFQAPLPLVVIDLEDGARLMVQGSPADAAESGRGRRGHLVAAPVRARAGHPGLRLQGVPGRRRRARRRTVGSGRRRRQGGWQMSWNKVAVVGAGLIKMGELFEQSYEQMAAGAFSAALASVDKGLDKRRSTP